MEKNVLSKLSVDQVERAQDAHIPAIEWQRITWYKNASLRKLYLLMPILFLSSTTRGYDASLLNGLQTIPSWKNCE